MASLLSLPAELMRMVTDELDPVDHVSLRSASRVLWATRDNLPRLNSTESVDYHLRYEKDTRIPPKKVLSLVCTYCQRLRPRRFFDDIMRKKKRRTRHCITCGIYHLNVGVFTRDGVTMLGCRGCYHVFPMITNVHWMDRRTARDRDSVLCHICWTRLFRGRQRSSE